MQMNLALARRRSAGTFAVLLLLLLTGAAAATTADSNAAGAAIRRWSSLLWLRQQGRRGYAARRLLLAVRPESTATVGKDTNEFHVEGVRRPANGKMAGEVVFDAGRRIPDRDANHRHN
jgi:cobalamin biosynthesis protein CbiG